MEKIFSSHLVRNLDGYFFRENFLVSSVVTVFAIRFFLKVTQYPELSGAGFHIAHLLWGGFFMLISLLILFSFLGRRALSLASVLGGIGFGTFIDELGKFVTSDNNYFFQPTVAILYVIFILIYIVSKTLSEHKLISKKEYLLNALEMVEDAVINDLDVAEKKRALFYLQKSDQSDPLVTSLKKFFTDINGQAVQFSWETRLRTFLARIYERSSKSGLLSKSLVVVILLQSTYTILSVGIDTRLSANTSFAEKGEVVSAVLSAIFMILGLTLLRNSRTHAFRFFKVGVMLSLLVTQFFTFYQEQFRALIGLGINIILLIVVDYAIDREEKLRQA